ncbi:MAG: hypothetical protein Q8R61_10800 [Thiobacillus sp.]|uniref:hypothetical protein n=1 Tax=Thiobacillus sp. TaxID=924 RepID=UPI002736B7C7|nr:hypothetical protein [Thiobacillus sp.]MDP3585603.1 hypothetical protein [Thiobacillus sp.]
MAENDKKPTDAQATKPAASPAPTAQKTVAAKPAARPRKPAAAAPATRSKATAATAKKPVARAAATRKSPPVKKAASKPAPLVAKTAKAGKPVKVKKPKLVRDSFTMPEGEYALIAALKKRCLAAGVPAKKSEILRAAVANLAKLSDASVAAALRRLDVIKTGRPAKGNK